MFRKIVLTGGPGGGKTTALDLFSREFRKEIITAPEAATLLYTGGIRRSKDPDVVKAIQKTIVNLQKDLECIAEAGCHTKAIVCDRGTLDGLAYWPDSKESFFEMIGSTKEKEYARYDAVLFFETGAISNGDIATNNLIRNETNQEAIILDQKLKDIWQDHPHFIVIKSSDSFLQKIEDGVNAIIDLLKLRGHDRR